MASVEDLPADQQAVLRLLLGQGRSYDQIAGQLGMAPAAVRDRAHDALIALGPQDSPLVHDAPKKPAARPAASLERPTSRRGGMLLLGGLALLAVLAIGFFVGRATKDSGNDSKTPTTTQAASGNLKVLGQTNLQPPAGTT